MRKEVMLLGCLVLAGCVTQPPATNHIRTPSQDRLFAFQSESDGDAQIIVTRDVGMAGAGCFAAVFIDGKVVAKLATGERAVFHVSSGDHLLGTWNTGAGLCGYREGRDRKESEVSTVKGQSRKYRITINPNSGVELNPTTL